MPRIFDFGFAAVALASAASIFFAIDFFFVRRVDDVFGGEVALAGRLRRVDEVNMGASSSPARVTADEAFGGAGGADDFGGAVGVVFRRVDEVSIGAVALTSAVCATAGLADVDVFLAVTFFVVVFLAVTFFVVAFFFAAVAVVTFLDVVFLVVVVVVTFRVGVFLVVTFFVVALLAVVVFLEVAFVVALDVVFRVDVFLLAVFLLDVFGVADVDAVVDFLSVAASFGDDDTAGFAAVVFRVVFLAMVLPPVRA